MNDRELEFIAALIDSCKLAARFYVLFACVLLLSGLFCLGWLLGHHDLDKIFMGGTSALLSLFSGIPAQMFFAARGQASYFRFLRASWQDASAENDSAGLQKLRDELTELRKGTLTKPFWSLR